ncbi:hypothetical protein R5R35_004120 [Gryllus longicercus]|uniref:Uncharacterized protein n=1 Tax=Gryllus longicercus TaxID=2509291 RepID=A0AAN9VNY2_9ORTH
MPSSAAALPATGAFWAGDATSARGRRLSELLAPPPPPLGSSASSGSGSSSGASSLLRHYIDPWDLENYAYLRRQDAAAAGCCSSTPALESSQSDFSYIPGSLEYPYPPPAVDEEPFYNAARTLRKTSSVMRRHSAAAAPNMHAGESRQLSSRCHEYHECFVL